MKNYSKNKESSYMKNLNLKNLFDWGMSKKFSVINFNWIKDTYKFNEDFLKGYNEERDEGFFLKVKVQYLENLHDLHNDLSFLPDRMSIEKIKKLETNLHDKTEYGIRIRNLKQKLIYILDFQKFHEVIKILG